MKIKGIVYLVGAGPGDAGLLTLRGAELLGRADTVVFDALIGRDVLRLVPADAESLAAPADGVADLLVAKAREGHSVVRLVAGDPYISGNGAEEAVALARAKIAFEVVPGVAAEVAALNYAGIPLTHRDLGSSFTIFHENTARADLTTAAAAPGAKVFHGDPKGLLQIAASLVAAGMPRETPACIVPGGTTDRQQTVCGTLASLPSLAGQNAVSAPAVMIVGNVVKLRDKLNWFEQRPLFGQRIIVTRARDQAGKLTQQLRERGAEVVELPMIKTTEPTNKVPLGEAIVGLNQYDWLVFTSVNGVNAFFTYFFRAFQDLRDIGGVKVAAVGPATAARLRELHLMVDAMPAEALGKNVARAIGEHGSVENLRICLLRAEAANPELPQVLEDKGAIVDDIACYRTVADTEDVNGAAADLLQRGADWLTFTSGSTVENFHHRFNLPELLKRFPALRMASIGPETSKALTALSLEPHVEASEHTMEGLVKALEKSAR